MAPQDLFALLPSEITFDILKRLSVRVVAVSKCVCKAWLDLLVSDYFVDSYHHSKSPALAVLVPRQNTHTDWCKVFEIEDEVDDLVSDNPITKFAYESTLESSAIAGSANGLLILLDYCESDCSFVYNPITREYIRICSPVGDFEAAYGFGASKVSGEHKVVRIVYDSDYCDVYTLGTGRWRRFEDATAAMIVLGRSSWFGVFVDGNIYWKVAASDPYDPVYEELIVCFDVETERFSTFPPPPVRASESNMDLLFTLRDCLCYLDDAYEDGIGVWLMKESWRKEYVIKRHPDFGFDQLLQPIKVFENGDILVLCDQKMLCRYSIKNKTYQEIQSFGAIREEHGYIKSFLLTPSFRSLERLAFEDVISF